MLLALPLLANGKSILTKLGIWVLSQSKHDRYTLIKNVLELIRSCQEFCPPRDFYKPSDHVSFTDAVTFPEMVSLLFRHFKNCGNCHATFRLTFRAFIFV